MNQRLNMRKFGVAAATILALIVTFGLHAPPAAAVNAPQEHVVNDKPSTATPNILNGTTETLTHVGSQIIAGGSFTSVAPPGSTSGVTRNHIVAFDADTGQISASFKPDIDGKVMSVVPGPTSGTVYVGGSFSTIDGQSHSRIALLSVSDGQPVSGFDSPAFNGVVNSVRLSGGQLYLGGSFKNVGGQTHAGLVSLNPTTGSLTSNMDLQLAGHHNSGAAQGAVQVKAMDIDPDGSRMVVIGNFTSISGHARDQVAMVDLGSSGATVDANWATGAYTAACFDWAFDTYVRAVDFSPNGNYFVISATGGSGTNDDGTNSSCDSAARFETNGTGNDIRPTWLDYTGQDTLSAVAITNSAVYVGGHERWMNNSKGHDNPGSGAVPRPGLAALNPKTGMPYSWNPGRNPRGAGTFALMATNDALYVGSDTTFIGNREYRRERVAKFPLAGGATIPTPKSNSLPANTYTAAPLSTTAAKSSNVLFRVDAGGPALASKDNGPDWMADQSDSDPGSQYRNTGSSTSPYASGATVAPNVPSSTPNGIFDSERYDGGSKGDNGEMKWSFPVASGTPIQVRLYFSNRYTGTSEPGQRVFDVNLDGQTVLPNYDIVADVGDQTGTMKTFDITSDGEVNIDFTHEVENPLIDGIEIVKQGSQAQAAATAPLLERSFDGSTVGSTETVPTDGIDWSMVRGSFVVGDQLFYGSTDGYLHERSFDDTGFGTDKKIDPYDDPTWSNVQTGSGQTYRGTKPDLYAQFNSVTGMFFDQGRLYYTKLGDNNLYSRWFEPESGIIGSDTSTVTGGDFSNIAGMFYADGHIYYADRSSGDLKRVDFSDGTIDGGSATTVSGPSIDGNSWNARGLFIGGAAQQPNKPPVAKFTSTCDQNTCSFDASGSTDPDGSVASYDWDFGDDSNGVGKSQSHAYADEGSYTVKLTVTDNEGATDSVTHSVSPSAPPASAISFVGAAHSGDGASMSKSVSFPDGTKAGDAAVLFFTQSTSTAWTSPGSGWTKIDSVSRGSLTSTLWVRAAKESNLDSSVTLNSDHYAKAELSMAVYSGVDVSQIKASNRTDSQTATHVTPDLNMDAGSMALSYWADKSSTTTDWTAPSSVTVRDKDVGTGTGRFSELLADSDTPVSSGSYGGLTATTDAPSGKAAMWTVALPAGSTPDNKQPSAAFTSSCDQGKCSFDASGSSDPDGSVVSYSWDFGDGSTGTGATPAHSYTSAGEYSIKLTVEDNDGATDSVTHQATIASPADAAITFVGSTNSGTGAAKSKHVDIPTATQAGDAMVLFFTRSSSTDWSEPGNGWTKAGSFTNGSIESTVWTKSAEASDPGSTITLNTSVYAKSELVLSVYSGGDADNIEIAHAGDSHTSEHATPTLTAKAGDTVVSFWSDKSSGTTKWAAPNNVTVRDTAAGSGGGRYSFLLADSGARVTSDGSYGGLTATTDATSGKAAMWSVAIPAATSGTNESQDQ